MVECCICCSCRSSIQILDGLRFIVFVGSLHGCGWLVRSFDRSLTSGHRLNWLEGGKRVSSGLVADQHRNGVVSALRRCALQVL